MLQLSDSLLRNVILWIFQVPSVDDQLLEKLNEQKYTLSLSAGTQKFSSA